MKETFFNIIWTMVCYNLIHRHNTQHMEKIIDRHYLVLILQEKGSIYFQNIQCSLMLNFNAVHHNFNETAAVSARTYREKMNLLPFSLPSLSLRRIIFTRCVHIIRKQQPIDVIKTAEKQRIGENTKKTTHCCDAVMIRQRDDSRVDTLSYGSK